MLIEPQEVEVVWNPTTREWYENLGYVWSRCGDKFIVPIRHLHPGSNIKVRVKCDFCGAEIMKSRHKCAKNEYDRDACAHCNSAKKAWRELNNRQKTQMSKFFKRCDDIGLIPISKANEYINYKTPVRFTCKKHGNQETLYCSFMNSKWGCPECAKNHTKDILKKSTEEVIKIVESKNNNLLLNPEDYMGVNSSNLRIVCGSCGEVFTTSLSSIMNSEGHCPDCGVKKCAGHNKLTPDEVEKRINAVNGNVLLNKEDYIKNSVTNLNIRCSCGNTYTTSLVNFEYFHVNRCPVCTQRTSQGELIIAEILDDLCIEYDPEHKFDDCRGIRPLPFDFYLPEFNAIIEFDGQHHYRPIFSEEQYLRTKKYDALKNKYCEDKGINLIRIPYWEARNAKSIITLRLGLDLDKTA